MCPMKKRSEAVLISLDIPRVRAVPDHGPRATDRGSPTMDSRKWWSVAALLALVGSLMVGSAVPAAGVDGVADHPATYSACVGPAAESAGFRDVVGSFAEDAVNCLAHYEITLGTDTGVFSPNQVVPRWQMALFLTRAAYPAGIVLPTASDQGFTDVDRVGPHTRDAVNQLAALGIMEGTSDSTFSPFETVTRQQMAALLARFLSVAPVGPGGSNIDRIRPDDDNFEDLGRVAVDTRTAIRKLFDLGITKGTTAERFSPSGEVNRARMAVFIARMLAHTNARPAGITAQAAASEVFKGSDVAVSISHRDTDHQPSTQKTVDVFMASDPGKAFDQDGLCTSHVSPVEGTRPCLVDNSDESTDGSGNISVEVEVRNVDAVRVWAWVGDNGDTFDQDTTKAAVVEIRTLSSPASLEVRDDLPPAALKARFGEAVTFTFQVVDDDGDPVRKSGVRLSIDTRESRDNGRNFEPTRISKETGPDGAAQVTFRHFDPFDEPGDVAKLDLDIRSSNNLEVIDNTTIRIVTNDRRSSDPFLDWADEPDEPATVTLSVPRVYRVASSKDNGVGSTVRATLTDQYGSPIASEVIVFTSSDQTGVPRGVRRNTNGAGVAALHYQRDNVASGAERITGRFGDLVGTVRQYWAARVTGDATDSGEVRVVDTDNNTIIVADNTDVWLIEYDPEDHFKIGNETVSIAAFQDDLTVGDRLIYEITGSSSSTNTFTLTNR